MVNKNRDVKKFALIHLGTDEVYGLEYVAAEIKRLGHKFQWFDGDLASVADDIIAWQPSYMCFSTLTTFFPEALVLSRNVKSRSPEIKSVFGGHHITAVPDVHTSDGVDIIVPGPVFGTIEKIAAGTAEKIIKGYPIPMHQMMPARREYFEEIGSIGSRHRKTIMSHFGCPYNCSYCSTHLLKKEYGKEYRKYWLTRRPVDKVIQEAKIFLEFPTKEVALEDDDMLFGKEVEEWLPEFADAWKKTIGLPIHGNVTPNTVVKVSDNTLDTLAELVVGVQMGVQAARRDTLKLYNRQFQNEEQVAKAIERLKSRGIPVKLELIIGAPVEDPVGDAIDTIKLAQRVGAGTFVAAFPLMLYPGTALYKWCLENNIRMKDDCNFDCYSGEGSVLFDSDTQKKITNISKMAAFFVKYNVDEHWMRALIEMDLNNTSARMLSESIYYESLRFQLGDQFNRQEFEKILANTRFKY